jgi:nucleoside-diphosphate-sugar epimerase
MKILVTGGTGFIGKNLVSYLVKRGHETVCLVRKTSKLDELESMAIPLVFADMLDAGEIDRVFGEVRPDVVYHCAAKVMDKGERELIRVNVDGTRNICQACFANGVKRLIYLSSVAVVSGNPGVPIRDDMPYKASNSYGRSKAAAERVVVEFRKKGLPVAIMRPCMVYGEGEPHALDRILGLVRSRRLPLFEVPGMDSKLNLVYIGNVVQAMYLALERDEALNGTFLVADREVITLKKFLEIAYNELGADSPPVVPGWLTGFLLGIPPFKRKAESFFRDRVYNISRAMDLLGYDPDVSTEEGLRKTIKDWKEKHPRDKV